MPTSHRQAAREPGFKPGPAGSRGCWHIRCLIKERMNGPSLPFPSHLSAASDRVFCPLRTLLPPLESCGGTGAAALPGAVQRPGLPAEPAPAAFVGAEGSLLRPGRASQAARLTSSATASWRRGGARVINTDEATRFSGFEAIASGAWWGWGRSGTWAQARLRARGTHGGDAQAPPPGRQERPPHCASGAQPSQRRGWGRPLGEGRCPPGDLAAGWVPTVLTAPPRELHSWGSKGQPCPCSPQE